MDKKEIRDGAIAGGLVILLLILYFATKTASAAIPATVADQNTDVPQQSAGAPPSYNMPPTLTLPPFNFGNGSSTGNNTASSTTDSCACNACGTGGTGAANTSFGDMTAFWNGINSGIVAPPSATPKTMAALPAISPITIPDTTGNNPYIAYATTYGDWYAQATQTGSHTPDSDPWSIAEGRKSTGSESDIPPGLTNRQIYFLYQKVGGNYLSTLGEQLLNSAVSAAYASPP